MCIGMNPIPNNVLGEWEIQMVPEDFQNRLLFLILLCAPLSYSFHHCLLMVGFNIAIKLFFKSFRDEEMLKELEHQRLQSELEYLKYQINPHFFMNTLNNIHALVDIDTGKAKSTIVELSKLMRYVLYEASNKTILLSREVQFLKNYIALMSLRYTNKVSIQMDFPVEVPEVQIPPLLLSLLWKMLLSMGSVIGASLLFMS